MCRVCARNILTRRRSRWRFLPTRPIAEQSGRESLPGQFRRRQHKAPAGQRREPVRGPRAVTSLQSQARTRGTGRPRPAGGQGRRHRPTAGGGGACPRHGGWSCALLQHPPQHPSSQWEEHPPDSNRGATTPPPGPSGTVKVVGHEERPGSCQSREEPTETWQPNGTWSPGAERGRSGKRRDMCRRRSSWVAKRPALARSTQGHGRGCRGTPGSLHSSYKSQTSKTDSQLF